MPMSTDETLYLTSSVTTGFGPMKLDMNGPPSWPGSARASGLSDLRVEKRLHLKLNMSGREIAREIARRIRAASERLNLCRELAQAGHSKTGQSSLCRRLSVTASFHATRRLRKVNGWHVIEDRDGALSVAWGRIYLA
jgi:hypothetical protein